MKDIDDIRRENLRALQEAFGGPTGAAAKLGMSPAQFANLRDGAKDSKTGKPRGMRKETARRIETAAGKPEGWLDQPHEREDAPAEAPAATAARQVSESEWALLQDFKILPEDEKQSIISSLRAKADYVRQVVAEHLARMGMTSTSAPDARVEEAFGTPPPSPAAASPAGPSAYKPVTPSAIPKPAARQKQGHK